MLHNVKAIYSHIHACVNTAYIHIFIKACSSVFSLNPEIRAPVSAYTGYMPGRPCSKNYVSLPPLYAISCGTLAKAIESDIRLTINSDHCNYRVNIIH